MPAAATGKEGGGDPLDESLSEAEEDNVYLGCCKAETSGELVDFQAAPEMEVEQGVFFGGELRGELPHDRGGFGIELRLDGGGVRKGRLSEGTGVD